MLFLVFVVHKPQRQGLRSSSAPIKPPEPVKPKGPQVIETWVKEEEMELWEIIQFGERFVVSLWASDKKNQ